MEWGLPDWQDKAIYGDVSQWTAARWRWEFTRRWNEYRAQAIAILNHSDGSNLETLERAFTNRWGFSLILDPRRSDYAEDELKTWPKQPIRIMEGSFSSERGESKISPSIGEVAFVLNPQLPHAYQLEIVARELKRLRVKARDKMHIPKGGALWLAYLRFLDALEGKEAGKVMGLSNEAIWELCRAQENTTTASQAKRKSREIVKQFW